MPTFNFADYSNGTALNTIDANWTASAGSMPSVSSGKITVATNGLVLYNDGNPLADCEAKALKDSWNEIRLVICSTGLNTGYEARLSGTSSLKLFRNNVQIYSESATTSGGEVKLVADGGVVKFYYKNVLKTTYNDSSPLSGYIGIPEGTSKSIIVGPEKYIAEFTSGFASSFGNAASSSQTHDIDFTSGFSGSFSASIAASQLHRAAFSGGFAGSFGLNSDLMQTHQAHFSSGFSTAFSNALTVEQLHTAEVTSGFSSAFGTTVSANEVNQVHFSSGFAGSFGEPMEITVDGWTFTSGFATAFGNAVAVGQLHDADFSDSYASGFGTHVSTNEINQAEFTSGFAGSFGEPVAIGHVHSITFSDRYSEAFGTSASISPTHEISFTDGFSEAFSDEFKALPHELVYFSSGFSDSFGLPVSVSPTHEIAVTSGFATAFGTPVSVEQLHTAEITSGFSSAFGSQVQITILQRVQFTSGFAGSFGEPVYAGQAIFPPHIGLSWGSTKRRLTGVEMSRTRGGKPRFVRRHHGSDEFEFDIELPFMTTEEWDEINEFHKRVGSHTDFRFLFKQLDDVIYLANFADESVEDTNPDSAEYFSTRLQLVGRELSA